MTTNKDNLPMEPDYVSDIVETGYADIAVGNIDEFTRQMMETGLDVFFKALDYASENQRIREEAFLKLSKDIHQAAAANDALSQKTIDNAAANSEMIRQIIQKKMIEDGELSPEEFKLLFMELRFYHDDMKETRRQAQAEREYMLQMEQMEADKASDKSGLFALIGGFLGGGLLGWGGKALYDHFTKK